MSALFNTKTFGPIPHFNVVPNQHFVSFLLNFTGMTFATNYAQHRHPMQFVASHLSWHDIDCANRRISINWLWRFCWSHFATMKNKWNPKIYCKCLPRIKVCTVSLWWRGKVGLRQPMHPFLLCKLITHNQQVIGVLLSHHSPMHRPCTMPCTLIRFLRAQVIAVGVRPCGFLKEEFTGSKSKWKKNATTFFFITHPWYTYLFTSLTVYILLQL